MRASCARARRAWISAKPARSSEPAARTLLALDAAGSACSVALWRDGRILASRLETMVRGQSERLVPMIEEVMAEAGLDYPALDAVAVTRGPGGFTGVRIGLATARGLALACARPLIGLSNFEVVGAAVGEAERRGRTLVVALDAKRRDLIYAQAFDDALGPCRPPLAVAPEALAAALPPGPLRLAGDGAAQAEPALRAAGRDVALAAACGPSDAAQAARLAATRPLPPADAPAPRPIYLRPPDATPSGAPRPRGRGRAP